MRGGVHLSKLVHRYQSVDRSRGDGGVSEQFLHDADVGAAVEEVGGEGVPQGMG